MAEKKKCFVVSPIGEEGSETRKQADDALNYVIIPACEGYEVVRADKISDNGMITQSVIQHLLTDDIVVADLTGHNPNVFYELAIRHSYGLPVIQITRDALDRIPFDIHEVRTVHYDLSASGADKGKNEIKDVLKNIENGAAIVNPITAVSGLLNLSTATPSGREDVLSELLLKVNSIPESIDRLEKNIEIRFSQVIATSIASLKTNEPSHLTEEDYKNQFTAGIMNTLMNDPQKGMAQLNNLMILQKMLDDSKKEK